MNGFFSTDDMSAAKRTSLPTLPACGECRLDRTCRSPKMGPSGKGKKRILIVGEAPGKNEDEQGVQFVGQSGQLLEEVLDKAGVDMRRDCLITKAAACHPPKNALPPKAIEHCRPKVIAEIREFDPTVVLLFGASPLRSVVGWLWKENLGELAKWVGWRIPVRRINAWVCPTWHPAFLLRGTGKRGTDSVLRLLFERHVQRAVELAGEKPWEEPLEPAESKVDLILDPSEAADRIDAVREAGKPFSFDYETDRKKPDASDSSIVCCSVCDGDRSFAFPWHGRAVKAMGKLLDSGVPVDGWNLNFENRWTIRHFGHPVRNWRWDGMLAAHVLDNRGGVTGLKFQAFAVLGEESWDDDIKPHLRTKGSGNEPNRIRDVPMAKLLRYCALDSLYEHRIGERQREQLGFLEEETSPVETEADPRKLARRDDPPTSKKAAEEIIPHLKGLHAKIILMVRDHPRLTVNELADAYEVRDPRTIGRRMKELRLLGAVRKAGVRPCKATGRDAQTWVLA